MSTPLIHLEALKKAFTAREGGTHAMTPFLNDLKHALRSLRRAPGFTLTAVMTLALGIGANAAMYSLLDRALGPLPYKDQDRLTMILREDTKQIPPVVPFQGPVFLDYEEGMTQADAMAAVGFVASTLDSDGEVEPFLASRVTPAFFRVVGFQPERGRAFLPGDDLEGAAPVIILSHGLWQRRFGGDPGVVGRSLRLNGKDVKVIGVMGASFDLFQRIGFGTPDGLMPLAFSAAERSNRGVRTYPVIMRMKPGATLASATEDARRIHRALMERYPGSRDRDYLPRVAPIKERVASRHAPSMLALMGLAGVVFLIACVNLANLLLARGLARQRELTICAAVGAGRQELISRLMAEGLVIGGLGGGLAFLVAPLLLTRLVQMFTSLNAEMSGLLNGLQPDPRAMAFTLLLALAAIGIFSLIPAWRASRVQASDALKEGSKGSAGPGQNRMRSALIVLEVSLAMLLLVGAGLLLRSLWTLNRVDPGFDPRRLLTVRLNIPPGRFPTPEANGAFLQGLIDQVSHTPGVRSATITNTLPVDNRDSDSSYRIEGVTPPEGGYTNALVNNVVPGYFKTMGIRLLRGRDAQRLGEEAVVINETLARAHWGGQDPLGRRLSFNGPEGPWYAVVGVVNDVQQISLGHPPRTQVYFASSRAAASGSTLCVRTEGPPMAVLPSLRSVLRTAAPGIPLTRIRTGEDLIRNSLAMPSILGTLFTCFGMLGLLLASSGLYGLMSFIVKQRTKEIGIRMALGGQAKVVVRDLLKRGLALTGMGLGIGAVASLAAGRVLASQLHGVHSVDPLAMTLSALVLGTVAMLATLIPASRAARVEPTVALRDE